MKQCPYCDKEFKTWKSVRGHTSSCKTKDINKFNGLEDFIKERVS